MWNFRAYSAGKGGSLMSAMKQLHLRVRQAWDTAELWESLVL